MKAFVDYDLPGFAAELESAGFNGSHAGPILREFYRAAGGACDWSRTRAGERLRAWLDAEFTGRRSTVRRVVRSEDGTSKFLLAFEDGATAETVLMPGYRPDRAAGCVSSQVGCAMGCDFCASTLGGLERNLEAGEIVEQFVELKSAAARLSRRLTSLVFMGMGEPMHNLDNVMAAIRRIADPLVGGLGWRQITVSTVGIVPGIDRLAAEDLNVHLALSLHAPDDQTRSRLVPSNRRYPVAEIIAAARRFAEHTGRVPTIEYCLLARVNDTTAHADALASLLADFRAHVNVIPYNPIGPGLTGRSYTAPTLERQAAFVATLRSHNVVAHVRDPRGTDVSAACGQLRKQLPVASC